MQIKKLLYWLGDSLVGTIVHFIDDINSCITASQIRRPIRYRKEFFLENNSSFNSKDHSDYLKISSTDLNLNVKCCRD